MSLELPLVVEYLLKVEIHLPKGTNRSYQIHKEHTSGIRHKVHQSKLTENHINCNLVTRNYIEVWIFTYRVYSHGGFLFQFRP